MQSESEAEIREGTTVADAKKSVETLEKMVERITDARKALDICVNTYKSTWADWMKASDTLLPEVRQWRMAMDAEWNTILTHAKDVRAFFLTPDHDKEVVRLKEFVELCERLKALKDSGFLDKVTDTILKLEVHDAKG